MTRYFFYNFFLTSFVNLMLYVPHILIEHRYTGAVSSMLISGVIGTLLTYAYTAALSHFPGMGLPEILRAYWPRWLVSPIMIYVAIISFISSTIVVAAFAVMINRFFNPELNPLAVLCMLVIACGYAASRSTLSVQHIIEVGLLLNAPIIFFVLFKMVRNPQLNWDAIHTVANFVMVRPELGSIAAGVFVFTGFFNLSIFNRLLPPNFSYTYRWLVPILGMIILSISFFVPIGFHGTEAVGEYLYVWSMTADSITLQYGFIERVLFLFLIVYLNLSLIYTMSCWHQAMEFIKSCFPKLKMATDFEETPFINYIICGVFAIAAVFYLFFSDERLEFIFTRYWLIAMLFSYIAIVISVFMLSRKEHKSA